MAKKERESEFGGVLEGYLYYYGKEITAIPKKAGAPLLDPRWGDRSNRGGKNIFLPGGALRNQAHSSPKNHPNSLATERI